MNGVGVIRVGNSICAWCRAILALGDESLPETHGICAKCAEKNSFFEVYSLADASEEILDRLPFGIIRLDNDGRILAYNRWESELSHRSAASVLGRSFFNDVAPCAKVQSFYGNVVDLQRAGISGTREFDFVFKFKEGCVLVLIQAVYNAQSKTTLLLVKKK